MHLFFEEHLVLYSLHIAICLRFTNLDEIISKCRLIIFKTLNDFLDLVIAPVALLGGHKWHQVHVFPIVLLLF